MTDVRRSRRLIALEALALLVFAIVAALLVTLLRDPGQSALPGGSDFPARSSATDPEIARASDASDTLSALEAALERRDKRAFIRSFGGTPSATTLGGEIFHSLSRLPLRSLTMDYVSERAGGVSATERDRLGGDAWLAEVEVRWALRGYDDGEAVAAMEMVFAREAQRTRVASVQPAHSGRLPEWLLGRIRVLERGQVLIIDARENPRTRIGDQAPMALRDVRRVLPNWHGGLVVVLPGSSEQLEQYLAAESGTYGNIAAVTTTADGHNDPDSPVRIAVNPPVYAGLGKAASQVVLSHEATHVATGATTHDGLPLWLVEGFADYIALAGEPVPLSVAASQVIEQVRREGPPKTLPGTQKFSTSAHGLGASYEAAWLATRLIAKEHGERELVRFYRQAEKTGDVRGAFRSVLGVGVKEFTRDWRAYLRKLAR